MSRRPVLVSLGVVLAGAVTAVIVFAISISLSDNGDIETSGLVLPSEATDSETGASPLPAAELLPTLVTGDEPKPAFVLNSATVAVMTPSAEPGSDDAEAPAPSLPPSESPSEPSPTTILSHLVVEGENLFRIAESYGVSLESIMIANAIEDSRLVIAGQTLIIPGEISSTPSTDGSPFPTEAIATEVNSQATGESTAAVAATTTVAAGEPTHGPTATQLAEATAPAPPQPVSTLNGIPIDQIVVMPEDVVRRARGIFASGQQMGRDSQAFSKVGDSTIENPHFLARFDDGPYNLGIYSYLQPTIDYYSGSFSRQGNAVKRGLHSWTVMDPMWADDESCEPNETPIDCEIRLHNPSILLIRLGSNDKGVPAGFNQNVRELVDHAIAEGILPVIGTKADRFEGEDNINNLLLRQIAADYDLPLWDFDLVAGTIPGRGLYENDVHLTIYYAHDYTSPTALQRGHGVHNLTALMVLDAIRREVIQAGG